MIAFGCTILRSKLKVAVRWVAVISLKQKQNKNKTKQMQCWRNFRNLSFFDDFVGASDEYVFDMTTLLVVMCSFDKIVCDGCCWYHPRNFYNLPAIYVPKNYPIVSRFCTCHGSWAAVTCAKLRQIFFRKFQWWVQKTFVKWAPGRVLCCIMCLTM